LRAAAREIMAHSARHPCVARPDSRAICTT
jgi:hypothetical protein